MCLTTVGRRSGKERRAILGYYEDGPNLVTMAMNGWKDAEPAWWLNLQAHPDATVELPDGTRAIHGRAAQGDERERLWARWREMGDDVDGYATRRPPGPRSSSSSRGPLPGDPLALLPAEEVEPDRGEERNDTRNSCVRAH